MIDRSYFRNISHVKRPYDEVGLYDLSKMITKRKKLEEKNKGDGKIHRKN
jgi:hypothetical protein